MADSARKLKRKIAGTLVAYVVGFVAVIAGVLVFQSPAVVGFALLWIGAVVVYAWQAFRCPLCGASIFNGPAGGALRWLFRRPRLCPRCRTDYEAAVGAKRGPRTRR